MSSAGLDTDDANAWVFWTAVMLAVAEVADPGLERWRVVLADNLAISLNGCMARDGSPFSGVVDEANVDRRVFFQVICLARLSVGVEEEIEAVSFLCIR